MKKSDGKYEGFCIDLLEEMAKDLEFNYTIVEVVDGTYGIEVFLFSFESFHRLSYFCRTKVVDGME